MLQESSHDAAGADNDISRLHAPPPHSSAASTFTAYTKLLPAVADRIIILACRSPEASCSAADAARRSSLALDVTTTLSLARVSKRVNKLTTPLLYESIRVVKPSALLELFYSVSLPSTAKLIKNLHIGSEDNYATTEWPLSIEDGSKGLERPLLRLKTTWSAKDEQRLPQWCEPERTWPLGLERVDRRDAREVAVVKAIMSALDYVDLDPSAWCYGKSGTKIGPEMWPIRIFELQACLDLYLAEMRRIEDAHKPGARAASADPATPGPSALKTSGPAYPRLVVSYISSVPSRGAARKDKTGSGGKAFVLTRQQLWQHLTRRGAALDCFDHPIIFIRPGLQAIPLNMTGINRVAHYVEGPNADLFKQPPATAVPVPAGDNAFLGPQERRIINNLQLAPYNIVLGLFNVARCTIELCSSLVNLSLNGYLDSCLNVPVSTYSRLRHLQLGPLTSIWANARLFAGHQNKYTNLESLRVCGHPVLVEEAQEIAGASDRFPKLKRFQWEMVMSERPSHNPLLATADGKSVPESDVTEQFLKVVACLQGEAISPEPQMVSRLMEVRVHRKMWLDFAGSAPPETLENWRLGTLRADEATGNVAPHRVRFTESAATKTEADPARGARMLHESAQEWWEECAKLEKERRNPGADWMPNASLGHPFAPAQECRGEVEHREEEGGEPAEGSKGALIGQSGSSAKEAKRIEAEVE